MTQQMTTIDSLPRRVVPWRGMFWAATTVSILVGAAVGDADHWGLVGLAPCAILLVGSAVRPDEYALSRRRLPKALVALFVLTLLVAAAAVVADSSGWIRILAMALPAGPSAAFTYLHLRTPPPPTAP